MRTLTALTAALIVAGCAHAAEPAGFSLTIYSSAPPGSLTVEQLINYGAALPGYALVRDARKLSLTSGRGMLRLTDVAKRIDPTTVAFESLTDPDGTRVVEQNFEFDLVDQQKLIARYIGQTITVEQLRGEQVDRVTGILLSASGGLIMQKPGGEVVTLNGWSNVQFPELPGGLITKPTLVWLVEASRGGVHDTRVSYQTQGMTWWADYNVTLREAGGCAMDLSAWVTLVNQSGASYPGTQLKLVAGEVNRAPSAPQGVLMQRTEMAAKSASLNESFVESSLFEYHLYTLGRSTDLPDNSTKQLELFPSATDIACTKQLVASVPPMPYWNHGLNTDQGFMATSDLAVGAYVEFENREQNHLGMPLPAGRVRVNQASVDGSLEFIGEDLIKHTPRNETLRVKLGNSFDVVGERRQTNFVYNDEADTIDESFEIVVRNRKQVATEVVVREYFYRWSNWEITSKSHAFDKADAQTGDFVVKVPADGEVKVVYNVRYSW